MLFLCLVADSYEVKFVPVSRLLMRRRPGGNKSSGVGDGQCFETKGPMRFRASATLTSQLRRLPIYSYIYHTVSHSPPPSQIP